MIALWNPPSPFHELELGHVNPVDDAWFVKFGKHMSDPAGYEAYLSRFPNAPRLPHGKTPQVDGKELFGEILKAASVPNDRLLPTIRALKASGRYKVWALTNNFPIKSSVDGLIHPLFDRIIGSIDIGMRKPDPRIYDHLLKELGLPGDEVVFLDDIGANLKAARKKGIQTIQVDFRTTPRAVQELHDILGTPANERTTAKL